MGKVITNMKRPFTEIDFSTFEIDSMVWTLPITKKFEIEEVACGDGAFRKVFKAISFPYDRKTFVIKKYNVETLQSLDEIRETPEAHARKSVQMHMLAKNLLLN